MSEWWTYRLESFLLFSPRTYWRLFELHNTAVWPLQLAAFAAGLVIAGLVLRRGHAAWIALTLAALWAYVGWAFLWHRYAGINWGITYLAPAFGVQALLLAAAGATGGLTFGQRDVAGWLGLMLAAAGLLAYPLLAPLLGRAWAGAEVFGIAPDPTAVATLGLLVATSGRWVPLLCLIPLLWLLLSGLTLRTMGETQALAPLAAAGTAVVLLILRRIVR
jgi:hypothetical protein